MYVFRPQCSPGHAPGCSINRNQHQGGRQAAKVRRRTQPKPRKAVHRRRHQLRDLAGHAGQVGLRPRLTSGESPEFQAEPAVVTVDELDFEPRSVKGGRQKTGSVRTRLKRRLVERSSTALVAALERRHGRGWPEYVLQGGFDAYEGMRRICEAWGLRPDVELQVIRRATDQARMLPWNRESSQAGLPAANTAAMPAIPAEVQLKVPSQGGRASIASPCSDDCCGDDCGDRSCSGCSVESDGIDSDAWTPNHAWTASLSFKEALETPLLVSPTSATTTRCPSQEPDTASETGSSRATPDGVSSEYDDDYLFFDSSDGEEVPWELGIEMPMPVRSAEVTGAELHVGAERGFTAAKRAAKRAAVELAASLEPVEASGAAPWRSTWRRKVLRALGLQLLWPSDSQTKSAVEERPEALPGAPTPEVVEAAAQQDVMDEEDEEQALSSKLVAAVQNAERQAFGVCANHADKPGGPATAHSSVARPTTHQCSKDRSVHFASKSEVSFFAMHADWPSGTSSSPLPDDYKRVLYTKTFDGPSGHKAKRSCMFQECRTPEEEAMDSLLEGGGVEPKDLEEAQEEWEDQCDDIAELMSQQRCCLMWSQAW